MAKEKLTNGKVTGFTCPPGVSQAFLWDSLTPGLAVRATQGRARSFVFQAKLNGKDMRLTIGDVRAWTLDKAREEARRLQMLVDTGKDPRIEKAEQAATLEAKREELRRQDVIVAEAWASYIEARRHKWSPRHLEDHEKVIRAGGEARPRRGMKSTSAPVTVDAPLVALMPLKLSDLTAARVENWLKEESARRPTYTALAYRLLRAFIRWTAGHPDYAAATHLDAVGARVAKDHVPRVKAKQGDSLQREMLAPWFAAVRALPNPVHAAYLQGLLLTGARREEWAGLRWQDVDFQWKSLVIHDKVEGERTIPLTPYLAGLLALLPRRNEWVFSSPTAASGRLQEPRIAHNKALTAAGLPALTLHGLRRSFGSLAEWVECPVGIVAQVMGHKPSALAERHYRRRPLDLLRMWHTRIEAWILTEAGIQQPEEEAAGLRLVANN